MRYFFFGTLMDHDVLEQVLDRAVAHSELAPAWLEGFRRVCAAHRSYPVLVPDARSAVEGRLLCRAVPRDAVRIRHFEDEEYDDQRVAVRVSDGTAVEARVFFALEHLGSTERPWDLTAWARMHKPHFLELCREWMRDCPV